MTERRVYTREFKAEAVRLVTTGTESVAEVAKRLGIDVGLLGKWKRAAERNGGVMTPGAKAMVSSVTTLSALEAELRRLRAENERLKLERDLLPLEMSIHRFIFSSPPHAKHLLSEVSADAGCVVPCGTWRTSLNSLTASKSQSILPSLIRRIRYDTSQRCRLIKNLPAGMSV